MIKASNSFKLMNYFGGLSVTLEELSNLSGRVSSSLPTSPLVPSSRPEYSIPENFFQQEFFPVSFQFSFGFVPIRNRFDNEL